MRREWLIFSCIAWSISALFAYLSGITAVAFVMAGVLIWWFFTERSVIPEMYRAALSGDAKRRPYIFSGIRGKLLLVCMFLLPAVTRQFGPTVYYGFTAGLCAGVATQFVLMFRSKLLSNYPDPPTGNDAELTRPRRHARRGKRRSC